jgi:hypothetical protein
MRKNFDMKPIYYILCLSMAVACFGVHAQERTASGALDNQVTWTALSTLAKAASDKADAVNARVDQSVVCGRKGMVYAPGVAGIDGDGCLTAATASTVINQLTNLQNLANGSNGCGAQGRVFNGHSCVAPASSAVSVSCRIETTGALGGGNSGYNGCPGGYSEVRGYNTGNHTTSCLRIVCN